MSTDFAPLLHPHRIAVVGASTRTRTHANRFIRRLSDHGFDGTVLPIHPGADDIEGFAATASLADLAEPVDFAFIAVPAPSVPEVLRSGAGKVRFAQVMSSGFGETDHGVALEAELLEAGQASGIRLLGPNCMGIQLPHAGLSMTENTPMTPGGITFLSQSGSLCLDLLQRGGEIGLNFNAVISIGNCADVKVSELADFLLNDPNTDMLAIYLEQEPTGRALFEALRDQGGSKPVVILKGGRSRQGQRAAASHTGALAGDDRIWQAMMRQTGTLQAEDQDDLVALLTGLQFYRAAPADRAPNRDILLFGNGGGTGVVAADLFARHGMMVGPPPAALTERLATLNMPDGSSIANPIDVPAMIIMREEGAASQRIVADLFAHGEGAAVVIYLSLRVLASYQAPHVIEALIQAVLEARTALGPTAPPTHLVLRSDSSIECDAMKRDIRTRAQAAGITVLDELGASARVLGAIASLEEFHNRRSRR